MSACKHPRLALSSASSDSVIRSLPSWRWPSVVLMWSLWDFRLRSPLCSLALCVLAYSTPSADLHVWHRIAFSPSKLLLTFSAPEVEAGSTSHRLELQLHALQLRLLSPPLCSLVAASTSFTSCSLTDTRSLAFDLAEVPSNDTNWIELEAENLAPAAIRSCEGRAALGGSFFVKIGGSLNESTASADSLDTDVDKCCRQDFGTCHTFATLEECELEKWAVECYSCEVNGDALGCPEFPSEVDGYFIHSDETACASTPISSSTASSVSDCAASCRATTGCQGFSLSAGTCSLVPTCCPGDAVPESDSFSFAAADCGQNVWQFSLVLRWQTPEGTAAAFDYGTKDVSGPGRLPLLPRSFAGLRGFVSSFTAAITPDVGLTPTGSSVTLELNFQSPAGFGLGDVLTFAPLPLSPFSLDVLADTSIVEVAGTSARLIYTDLPGSVDCVWFRVGGFRVNGVKCTAGADFSISPGQQPFSLRLELPMPMYGLSADWVLALEASATGRGSVAFAADVLALTPPARLQQLRSAVQAAGTQTTVELAVQLGLWAGQVDVFITAPSLALRDVTSCTAAPGSALLAVEVAVWDGIGCRLTQVSNPHPPSEIRLRLDAENRGTVAGTRDVLTMMINWASRTHFAAAREAYSIVPEFGGELGNPAAGAVLAFSVRGTVSPLTVHFPTATDTAYYATCAADMHLQLSLMRDQLLVLRSASGSPLTAKEDAECAEVLLEVYGSTEFPAPISCSWDSMTQKGDAINMAFGNSVGLPTPETGQWYAFVLLAEILGVQADSSAALGLTLRCGNEALESSPLDLREPAGALQLQGLGSAAVLEVVSGSTTQMTLKGLLSGAAQKLRFVFLPSFGSRAWSAEGSPAVASVDYWSNADAAGQPAGSQSISGVGLTFIDTSGLPATVLDLQIPGSWTSMRSLRVSLTLADATLSQGLATGFAAHSYVWAELRRSTSSDVAKLQSASFSSPPSELRGLQIVPSSLMGGASQELELLLRLGFVARGISLQVTPPAGFLIAGHGPTPSGPAYRRLPGVRRDTPLPVLPSGTPSSGAVTLTVPGTTVLWQASTYTYSMNVQNPASMTSQNVWNVQLQLSASFPDASMPVTVQKEISSDDGAFPVVMALQHCSLAPSSMLLGARQQIQVFFTVPSGLDVSSPSQPLALRLLAPAAFFFSEVQFQPLQGLPPAMAGGTGSACSVLLPTEVRCMLPLGFAFNSGAYGFQVTVANPSQTESLQASAYQPGWALRLESSDAEPLLSICEDIPRSPSDNLPFPLYLREMEQRIFSVVFAGAAGAGQSVAVVAVFQVSAVPAGAWLTLRSPGWSWQPELGVETRSSFLLRGTTHNLPAANADEASVLAGNPAALSLQLADALQGGRVYGLQAYILTPSARQPYDRWSAELSGTAEADLVSVTNYEAAIGSFSNMRVPAVSDCAVLPFSLQAGQTPVLVSFTRASRLNPGDYLQILLPPNIQGEEPCRSFLDGAEPFYPELSLFGHVYPVFVPLPENTTCEWTTSGGRPALRLYHRATTSADAASHLISIAVRVPSGQQAQAQNIWEIGTFTGGGTVLDTSCSLTAPFELIDAQVDMVAASALQAQWTSDTSKSTLFVGFELSRQAPAAVLLRAPFGLRTAGARCSAGLRLQGAPGGYSNFPVGNRVVTCLAGGGDGSAFSSRAAPLLEGIVEVEVIGATLLAGTRYALGIELYIPAGLLYQNSWFLAVGNQVAALEGADLMRVETAEVQASFPGLALRSAGPLPYNDVQVRLTFGANVSAAASMLIAIPPIFVVVTEDNNRLLTAELVDTCLCLWVHVVYVGHTFNGLAMASAGEVDAHEAPPEPACGDPELATEPSGGMAHMPADSEDLTGASREATADGKTSEKAKGSGKAEVAAPADIAGISREATAAADARPGPSEKEEKLQSRPEDKQREIARPVQSLTGVEAASDENGAAASVPPQATNPGPSLDKQVASEPEAGDHGHHGPSRPMLSTGTSDSSPQEPLLQAQAPRSSSAPEDVPVVITREEVAEAVEDMRRYGASLVRPVADAMEATRAHGAVALERGAEAASEARRQGNAALQSSVETAEAQAEADVNRRSLIHQMRCVCSFPKLLCLVPGQREIDADYPLSFMVARLSSIHEKRVQTAVKVFEAAKEDAVCKQKSAMRFSTKETRFNDLIMVAMLSNLSHIFEIGGNTVTNHVSMIVLWVIMIQSLHSVSFVVNLWNMDDLFTLLCCFGTTLGSVWMAAAARPSVVEMSVGVQASQKRELRLTVKSDVHPPCTAAWVDTPRYVQRFDCGALISQASQIAISTQAAIFNENARDHVDTWWQIVVVAVMLIANVCIALVIVFLACKMAYPALVEYHYGSLVVSRSTLQKYRLLHVVARVNLLSLKCRTAEHDVQMNSPMMYAASTKVYDSPRASCLHHKCINCCIHLAPSALQCRTLRAHVHLEVLLHRKYVIVAAFCASSYFICWKFTTVMELLDLQHLRGEWVITCIIREIDLISLISQTSLDLMLAAEYFNTKQHGDESHDLAKLSLQAVDKNAYGSAVLEFLGIYTAVCHCHVFVLLASIGERGYRHAAVQGERPRTCRSSQPSHVILVGFSGQLRHRVWLDDECASMALSGDSCKLLNGSPVECTNTSSDEVDQVWLLKGAEYIVTLRVQNPATCHSCSPAWQIFLKEQVTWSSEAQGFHLVGEVADFVVEPSHRLGDSSVLLTVMIHLAGRLLLQDRVVFTVPSGWELDPLFCESPVAQAAMVGLKAPPSCSSNAAVLTVYEMDLPPLSSPQLQLRLEGMAPEFGLWQAKRTEWIGILAQASDANTSASAPLPFEFSVEVRRRSQSVLTVSAAGKVQAYEVMPNMAPNCELAISSASLASLAAMRLSLRPSESIDAFVNSIWIRSSLPYDFRGCSLLWEEPADRAASRPEDPVFRFAGEPRCVGQLTELTLFGVLLDTSIKDQVTVYVANFTVPRPPYAAKESRWEVALLRSRSGLEPLKKDHGIGLPGPGAFGGLLVSAWASEEQPQFSHTHLFDRADMSREPIRCESDIDSRDEPAL
eukprot:s1476_g4.t3